jgi:hypothetical protein
MKSSGTPEGRQLRLALETDESRIWESLESDQQRQALEYLARLWWQHVVAEHATVPCHTASPAATSPHSSGSQE